MHIRQGLFPMAKQFDAEFIVITARQSVSSVNHLDQRSNKPVKYKTIGFQKVILGYTA